MTEQQQKHLQKEPKGATLQSSCFVSLKSYCFVSFHKKIYEHPEETVSFLDKFYLYLQEPEDKSILEY